MKREIGIILLVLLFCFTAHTPLAAQTDTIGLHGKKLFTRQLKTGVKQYLVYFQSSKQSRQLKFSLWVRDISLKTQNGEQLFAITQQWYGTDTTSFRSVYSLNRVSNFEAIYQSEAINGKLKAYNWYNDHISGADSIPGNEQKTFNLQFDRPAFNWHLDIETYEMMQLKEGKTIVIYFYDAGFGKPSYQSLKVTGSEMVTTLDNQKVDCWKLFTSSDQGKVQFTETYWISKKNHELLKEEDYFNGNYRYKIKLPGYSPELLKRFTAQK